MAQPLVLNVREATSREAPMTWGQLTQQVIFDFTAEESYRQTLVRTVDLATEVSPDHVIRAVGALLTRHEALRTLFVNRRQHVQGDVELEIPVIDVTAGAVPALSRRRLSQQVVRHGEVVPVGFQVLRRPGGARTLDVVTSHLAADRYAMDLLAQDLRKLLQDAAGTGGAPARQPVDRARYEETAAGRRVSSRNIERWVRMRDAGLTDNPGPTLDGLAPRFWTATFVSPRLGVALPIASARLGVPGAAVLLAAMGAALGETLGVGHVAVRYAFDNRTSHEDDTVETLMQWGLSVLATAAASPAELARRAFTENLRAAATARYDPYRLLAAMHGVMPQVFLNYDDSDAGAAPGSPMSASGVPTAPEGAFSAAPGHQHDSDGLLFVFANRSPGDLTLRYLVDTRLMSLADLESSARAMEGWVQAAAR